MAAIAYILRREKERKPNEVRLYKEGMFWRAYEQSAYLLAVHTDLKPQKKQIKAVNQEVVYVGFPESSWEKFTGTAARPHPTDHSQQEDRLQPNDKPLTEIVLHTKDTDTSGFADWKAQLKTVEEEKREKEASLTEEQKAQVQKKQEQARQRAKLTKELPVYQVSYDLLKYYMQISRKMQRDVRYTIAQTLQDRLFEITMCTRRAQRAREQSDKLQQIDRAIDLRLEAELQIRLLYDLHVISLKKYTLMSEQIISLEKHLENWKAYFTKQT